MLPIERFFQEELNPETGQGYREKLLFPACRAQQEDTRRKERNSQNNIEIPDRASRQMGNHIKWMDSRDEIYNNTAHKHLKHRKPDIPRSLPARYAIGE